MKSARTFVAVSAVLILASTLGVFFSCGRAEGFMGRAERAAEPVEELSRDASAPLLSKIADDAELVAELAEEGREIVTVASEPKKAAERKRIYNGFCRLIVDEVEEAKAVLTRFAEQNGGYVEKAFENTIVLRVPAPRFRELFEDILDKGELLYKSIETFDVSDYFRDQETRLRFAERARRRLYALLERTDDVEEKLAILREIKRLSEEIERISLRLGSLERQISFSRITVELVPRLPVGQLSKEDIPFPWIASLEPVYGSLPRLRGRASLPLGEDFAVLEKRRSFRAESSGGTRVRIGSTQNQPRGNENFWQQALLHHLNPYYKTADPLEVGSLRGALFTSKDRNPYAYLVAVRAKGGRLYVVEVFFPDLEARAKHLADIREALLVLEVRPWLW
jgi:hypothetical protein